MIPSTTIFDGNWLISQLKRVVYADGWIPTRVQTSDRSQQFKRSASHLIRNAGIHAVVLERITQLVPPQLGGATIRAGLNSLWREAIWLGSVPVWRWVREPVDDLDELPPDYDDTAWAYRATASILNYLSDSEDWFSSRRLAVEAVDLCGLIERDLCQVDSMYRIATTGTGYAVSVYFDQVNARGAKLVDPVVSTHVLGEILRRHAAGTCRATCRMPELLWTGLNNMLLDTNVEDVEFCQFSRYYLSLPYFLYALSRTLDHGGWQMLQPNALRRLRAMALTMQQRRARSVLDTSWTVIAAKRIGAFSDSMGREAEGILIRALSDWDPELITAVYRDPRRGHVFGSEVLDLVFGFEALREIRER